MLKTDHPWIKEDGEAPDKPLDNAVLNRLKQFRAMNQFKKVALRVLCCFGLKSCVHILHIIINNSNTYSRYIIKTLTNYLC